MIEFCKNCIMPNSRPRIEFNKKGVCNACTNYIEKQSIDCKKENENYKLTIKSGTILTDIDPIDATKKALKLGAGEIMINNIDNDGSLLGYDIDFLSNVSKKIDCSVLALGGAGNWSHIVDLFKLSNVTGACTQNIFHFTEESISSAKNFLIQNGILVRT